jgi:hypothetical protein
VRDKHRAEDHTELLGTNMSFRLFSLLVAMITTLGAGATGAVVLHDDASGYGALAAIAPLVSWLGHLGLKLCSYERNLLHLANACVSAPLILLLILELTRTRGLSDKAKLYSAALFLVQGQMCLLTGYSSLGVIFYGAALACAWSMLLVPTSNLHSTNRARYTDLMLYCIPFTLLLFTRFYALNRIPPYFEGELSPYMLGATNVKGILLANAGIDGPWAPLGFLYYIPMYLSIKVFGPTLLAVRISSVFVNILTFFLAFLLSFRMGGRWASFFTGLFMALESLQIGWGRTDIHPHGATTWVALLICLILLEATRDMQRFSRGLYWWPIAALMGLSWHQYPSGQSAVFIPFIFMGLQLLLLKKISIHQLLLPAAAMLVGAGLWVTGGPLSSLAAGQSAGFFHYFEMLGPRLFQSSDAQSLTDSVTTHCLHVAHNLYIAIHGVFISLVKIFHQDILQEIPGVPVRSVNWSVAALLALSLVWFVKERFSNTQLILWSWVVCALIPAIFSADAFPKRSSNLFVALILLSSISFSAFVNALTARPRIFLLSVVCLLVCGWTAITTHQWFGSTSAYGVSLEERVATVIRTAARGPDVLFVSCGSDDSSCPGKLSFLLSFFNNSADTSSFRYFLPNDIPANRLVDAKSDAAPLNKPNAWYNAWGGSTVTDSESSWLQARYIGYVIQRDTRAKIESFSEEVQAIYPSAVIYPVTNNNVSRGYIVVVIDKSADS